MRLGDIIRRYRTVDEIGLQSMADEIRVSVSTLSRFERGKPVDGETLVRILRWAMEEGGGVESD